MKDNEVQPQSGPPRGGAPPLQAPPPWRTEGLPPRQPPRPQRGFLAWAPWVAIYVLAFGALTLQDRSAGPQPVPYTEFKTQVESRNVHEVFARGNTIQGALKQPRPVPGDPKQGTYQKFTTERPTFAADDLLSELTSNAATVRATPLVQERGFLTNLLVSMAPLLLLFGFWAVMLKRQRKQMGGGIFGGSAHASRSIPRACASPSRTWPASTRSRRRSARSSTS